MISSSRHIPPGFTSVTPFLTVEDPEAMLAFAKAAFDAEELNEQRGVHDGKTQHLAFRVEGSVVEVGLAHDRWRGLTGAIHLFVPNVEAVYARSLKAGGTSLHEPMSMDYGERAAAIRDPSGNHWYIATYTGSRKK